jgi:type III pantothenate kinase
VKSERGLAETFNVKSLRLSMLLAIDIGNTFTKFGIFYNDSLYRRTKIPTIRNQTAAEIYNSEIQPVHAIIISSVVPELKNVYLELSQNYYNLEPIFVDNTFDFNLKIKYFPPENLGVDRLVAAFAATEKYGVPCIVCDFGTATTIDVVNSKREFLGGIIAPGMQTMAESLSLRTSQLPKIEIGKPETVIGNSTKKSIESGIYFGYIGLVNGIIERMAIESGEMPKVVATGGFAKLIAESSAKITTVDDNLMLDGLNLIYARLEKIRYAK